MFSRKRSPRPAPSLRKSSFRPRLEELESRLAPAVAFDALAGSLSITGGGAVHVATTADGALTVNDQVFSSDLAGTASLRRITQTGGGTADSLTLDNLTTANLTVQTDGAVIVAGNVQAAGLLSVTASSLTIDGSVHAAALWLSSSGLFNVEAGGSLVAQSGGNGGWIAAAANDFVNVGQVRADGATGGLVTVYTRDYLDAGAISASGAVGAGGSVQIGFTESYIDTASAATTATGAGGAGGLVSIQGGSGGRLFSSGRFGATGATGGGIDLFGHDVLLVAATADASGTAGSGGRVRIGGDYHGASAGVPNAQTVNVTGATTVRADAGGVGAGGRVIIWSEARTDFAGSVSARSAGGGAGGFIETSSHGTLADAGTADAGVGGTLLLDPQFVVVSASAGVFPQFSLIDPGAGSGSFGTQEVTLTNGNIVVTDPTVNSDQGAAYLFDGVTGALLGTVTGGAANTEFGAVTSLGNGNFIIVSPNWNNGVGAVTWSGGTAATAVSGVITFNNSLVGSSIDDQVGAQITVLPGGNYVVVSSSWNNSRGAVTFGNGTAGVHGFVGSGNSLVGNSFFDQVGVGPGGGNGVIVLPNGNYLVDSPNWANSEGAVTFGSQLTGVRGVVGQGNSLIGGSPGDRVGEGLTGLSGITILPNDNYIVNSPNWTNDEGAVTLGSGTSGIKGPVSASNSLVGSVTGDRVGEITDGSTVFLDGITVLTNGNFVVDSSNWGGGMGAVTWSGGTMATAVTGTITSSGAGANSLVGTNADGGMVFPVGDHVGFQGVTALSNGNYVVSSADWSGGLGAATWGRGTSGVKGTINGSFFNPNSLVGSLAGDHVGGIGVIPGSVRGTNGIVGLPNGNYVVLSPDWNGTQGAATFGNGSSAGGGGGVKGTISSTGPNANSLVGNAAGDNVGSGGVTALHVGGNTYNYVVDSPNWSDPNGGMPIANVGAVTFGSGATGVKGTIISVSVPSMGITANSLVGSAIGDRVGSSGVTALNNGNYIVDSSNWSGGKGAATWGSRTAGVFGAVSALNSLVGTAAGDRVGSGGIVPLPLSAATSNYLVVSPNWTGGEGAVTFSSGTAGVIGPVTAVNSLVGTNPDGGAFTTGDHVGALTATNLSNGVTVLPDGNYLVVTYHWNGGAGAVTWGSGTTGVVGPVSALNSVVGSNPDSGFFTDGDHVGYNINADAPDITTLPNGNFILRSLNWNSGTGAVTFGSETSGVVGVVSAMNSLVGGNPGDDVGGGGFTILTNGHFVVSSPDWNGSEGAATWGSSATGVVGVVSALNSLVGTASGDRVGSSGVVTLANGAYVVISPDWNSNQGAATWADGAGKTLDGLNTIDAQNSILGSATSTFPTISVTAGASAGLFVADFAYSGAAGFVVIGFTDPNLITFALGQDQIVTVTPAFLLRTLTAGGNVVLQANDDITINDPIVVPAGPHGNLTLQAGRSILLNANISTNGGNLTLIANDTLADGVVNAERTAGAADITMQPGVTLDAGGGALSVDLKADTAMPFKTNHGVGAATLLDLTANSTTLSSETVLGIVINGTNPGDGTAAGTYTQTNVTGPITLGGTLHIVHTVPIVVGSQFHIVTTTGGFGGSTFTGLPEGATVLATDGTPFSISYLGNGGNDVVLTAVALTATVVTSSMNPGAFQQPVTFTATVTNTTGAGGAPTGSVEFYDGVVDMAHDLGPGTFSPGTATSVTFTSSGISSLSLGDHVIIAVYTPTGGFVKSTGMLTERIGLATTTVVTSNNNPSTFGEAVTFTATVTNTSNNTVPTGSVEFFDGPSFGTPLDLGAGHLVSTGTNTAVYTLTVTGLATGGHTITASFTPTNNFIASSNTVNPIPPGQTVKPATPVNVLVSDGSLLQMGPNGNFQTLSQAGTILAAAAVTDGIGLDQVYAITADHHLWQHNSLGWSILSSGSFQQIAAAVNSAGNPVVFGVLTDNSLWENSSLNPGNGWMQLSGSGTILSVSAVTDSSGNDVAFAITADQHLWEHSPAIPGGWTPLSSGAFLQTSAGRNAAGQAIVFGVLADNSLWEYSPANSWQMLSGSGTILSVSAGANDEVFAITADHHLWDHTLASSWTLLSQGSFANISATQTATGHGQVFATLTDSSFWEWEPLFAGDHWQQLLPGGVARAAAPQLR